MAWNRQKLEEKTSLLLNLAASSMYCNWSLVCVWYTIGTTENVLRTPAMNCGTDNMFTLKYFILSTSLIMYIWCLYFRIYRWFRSIKHRNLATQWKFTLDIRSVRKNFEFSRAAHTVSQYSFPFPAIARSSHFAPSLHFDTIYYTSANISADCCASWLRNERSRYHCSVFWESHRKRRQKNTQSGRFLGAAHHKQLAYVLVIETFHMQKNSPRQSTNFIFFRSSIFFFRFFEFRCTEPVAIVNDGKLWIEPGNLISSHFGWVKSEPCRFSLIKCRFVLYMYSSIINRNHSQILITGGEFKLNNPRAGNEQKPRWTTLDGKSWAREARINFVTHLFPLWRVNIMGTAGGWSLKCRGKGNNEYRLRLDWQ